MSTDKENLSLIEDLLSQLGQGNLTEEEQLEAMKDLIDVIQKSESLLSKMKIFVELVQRFDKEGSWIVRQFLEMLEKTKKPIYPEEIRELKYTMMPPEYWLGEE